MNKSIITYSLWALFNSKDERFLKKIKKLSNFLLSEKNFREDVSFPIHITMISNIDKEAKNLKQNIKKIKKFKLQADGYSYKRNFFQSFFIKIKNDKKLKKIKKDIDKKINIQTGVFLPHISLNYGDQKSNIKKKSIHALPHIKNKVFNVNKLCIAMNDEKNLRWKIVKKFNI